MKTLVSVLLLLLGCVPCARADVFAILPPYVQGERGYEVGLKVSRIIEADLAGQSVKVLPPEQTVTYVPKEQRTVCDSGECAERYRAAAMATAVVMIRVYRATGGIGPPTSFQIAIQPKLGVEYAKGDVFGDSPLEDVVRRVFREVLNAYRNPGPWLQVLGEPKGADVYLDGRHVGVLPWTDRVPVGKHELRVEAAGYEPQSRLVPLSAPGASAEERFSLEPAHARRRIDTKVTQPSSAAAVVTDSRTTAGPVLIAMGAPVLLTGALWAGFGASSREKCDHFNELLQTCDRARPRSDSTFAVASGVTVAVVGAAALIVGSVMVVKQRRARLHVDAGAGRASIGIRGEF